MIPCGRVVLGLQALRLWEQARGHLQMVQSLLLAQHSSGSAETPQLGAENRRAQGGHF